MFTAESLGGLATSQFKPSGLFVLAHPPKSTAKNSKSDPFNFNVD